MSKLLRRFTYLMLLGIVVFLLTTACSLSRREPPRSFLPAAHDCRMIKHSMGETCIPKSPQRVVTIFHGILGNALSFGVKPIASSTIFPEEPFPTYLKNQVDGVEPVGLQGMPDLEKILKQKPDLILVWQNIQAIYPLLSKIAPTVIVPWRGPSAWREQIQFVAKALSKEKESQQLWKLYYQRVNRLKVALDNQYQDKEISVFSLSSQWGFFVMAKNSFSGSIINDLGLKRPKMQDVDREDGYISFTSEEQLDIIDGNIMFVLTRKEEDRKAFEKIIKKPLGKKLKAVQQGQIYFIKDALPWNGATFPAADIVLDDIEKYLVKINSKK
jgi:iron complex transport system substrate-binding protein